MLVCDLDNDDLCWLSVSFGIISIIYLASIVKHIQIFLIFKYYRREEKKVLFFLAALCTSMILHYFLIADIYDVLYFVKEYLMLVVLSYICYYFLYHMYKLIQTHTVITFIGLTIIVITIVYLSVIAIYFTVDFFIADSSVFECSNDFWILIRAAELVLSLLFLIIGLVISKKLREVKIIYKAQVKKKEKNVW